MSGTDKWVPFFEETSERRDSESWWNLISAKVLAWGLSVSSVVSDRAKALVSLGETKYLDVVSMPDLFHFVQDISKNAGCQIGHKVEQARKGLGTAKDELKTELTQIYEQLSNLQKSYRVQIERINKSIHPFDEDNQWEQETAIEKNLLHCFTKIGRLAKSIDIEIEPEKASKIFTQIAPIAKGVQQWINQTKAKLDQWVTSGILNEVERKWLENYALPSAYWKIQCRKTQAKLRNKDLRTYYKDRTTQAFQSNICEDIQDDIPDSRKEELWKMAHRLAESFQRSSSQVEGRNGYLSFVNHANRGIPKQRLKVLTVIHNYDIKRADGTTPAQRLFDKEFPDIFEFLCLNVTGFKEPRKKKLNR